MELVSRNLLISVLLGLVISNASLGVHVATHTDSDTASCQFCTSWTHAAPALAHATGHAIAHPQKTPSVAEPAVTSPGIHRVTFRQRGPPTSN